ncbi:MAG: ribonuclease P protein component [Parcubacteria group bacterium Gr01-1014_31]|nr:MAG: ribonuclease P protein component [Parcubacteria group bacterium Gr01-1014_31]
MAVLRHGAMVRGGGLTVRVLPTGRQGSRFAFVVSNKVSKHAVQRNRLRRQLRELVRAMLPEVAGGYDVVVTVQPGRPVRTTVALKDSLAIALRRVRLLSL